MQDYIGHYIFHFASVLLKDVRECDYRSFPAKPRPGVRRAATQPVDPARVPDSEGVFEKTCSGHRVYGCAGQRPLSWAENPGHETQNSR